MPSAPYFDSQMGQYSPLPHYYPMGRPSPFEHLQIGGPLPSLAAMAAGGPFLQGLGAVPIGYSGRNVADTLRGYERTSQELAAMNAASLADRDSIYRTLRGISATAGVPFGPDQRRAASSLADTVSYGLPLLAQFNPELVEQLAGPSGSATLLARSVYSTGRYRIDPVTGRPGLSADSAGAIALNLAERFREDPRAYYGLTAGKLGSLAEGLQARGLLDSGITSGREEIIQAARQAISEDPLTKSRLRIPGVFGGIGVDPRRIESGGLDQRELQRLSQDPSVSSRLRVADAGKIDQSLKKYSEVISAVNDIFGDAGHPNAPIGELLKGIDALTLASTQQVDPARLAEMVRKTRVLSRQAGLQLDAVTTILQSTGQVAGQYGLSGQTAVQASQGAIAFGAAYRQAGLGAYTAPGLQTPDQLTQIYANLGVQAAASPAANRAAALIRLANDLQVGPDTELGRYVNDARSGRAGVLTQEEGLALAGRNGIDAQTFRAYERHGSFNRNVIEQYDIGASIRNSQRDAEVVPILANQLQSTITDRLTSAGVDVGKASELAGRISGPITQQLFGLPAATFRNNEARQAALEGFLSKAITDAGGLAGVDPATLSRAIRTTAGTAFGDLENRAQSQFGNNLVNLQAIYNPQVDALTRQQQDRAAFSASIEKAAAPIGRDTLAHRALAYIQGTKVTSQGQFNALLKVGLGGIDDTEISEQFRSQLYEYQQLDQELAGVEGQIATESDPAKRAELIRNAKDKINKRATLASSIQKQQARFGVFGDNSLSRDRGKGLRDAVGELEATQRDLEAVSAPDAHATGDTRASSAFIAKHRQAYPDASEEDLRYAMDQEHRASRAGLTNDYVNRRTEEVKRQNPDMNDLLARATAVDSILREQEDGDFEVGATNDEREKNLAQRQKRVAIANRALSDPHVADASRRLTETVIAQRDTLVNDPKALQVFGVSALRISKELQIKLQREQELANEFAGGSVEKFRLGAYTGDLSNEDYLKRLNAARQEGREITGFYRYTYDQIHQQTDPAKKGQLKLGDATVTLDDVAGLTKTPGDDPATFDKLKTALLRVAKGEVSSIDQLSELSPDEKKQAQILWGRARSSAQISEEAIRVAGQKSTPDRVAAIRKGVAVRTSLSGDELESIYSRNRQEEEFSSFAKTFGNDVTGDMLEAYITEGADLGFEVSGSDRATIAGQYDKLKAARDKVSVVADKYGYSVGDLDSALTYEEALKKRANDDRVANTPEAVLDKVAEGYGFQKEDASNPDRAKHLAALRNDKVRNTTLVQVERRLRIKEQTEALKTSLSTQIAGLADGDPRKAKLQSALSRLASVDSAAEFIQSGGENLLAELGVSQDRRAGLLNDAGAVYTQKLENRKELRTYDEVIGSAEKGDSTKRVIITGDLNIKNDGTASISAGGDW